MKYTLIIVNNENNKSWNLVAFAVFEIGCHGITSSWTPSLVKAVNVGFSKLHFKNFVKGKVNKEQWRWRYVRQVNLFVVMDLDV